MWSQTCFSIFLIFKKNLLKFIRPSRNSVLRCHNNKGVNLLTRLRLGLSHLRKHKFKHGSLDSLKPICSLWSTHFLLHWSNYFNERLIFLNTIRNIDGNIFDINSLKVTETQLYGDSSWYNTNNALIMDATMEFLADFRKFNVPLV